MPPFNPYQTLGLSANASKKEIEKRRSRITALRKLGREIRFDADIALGDSIRRDEEALDQAFRLMGTDEERMAHAHFWFVSMAPWDDIALEHLRKGHVADARTVWEKVTKNKPVRKTNVSGYHNLSVLHLMTEAGDLEEGLRLKAGLFSSNAFEMFCHAVVHESFVVNASTEAKRFVEEALRRADDGALYTRTDLVQGLVAADGMWRAVARETIAEDLSQSIEAAIAETGQKRKRSPRGAKAAAKKLYARCRTDMDLLLQLVGESDLTYRMVADNLAKEILQCGIDHFQECNEGADDPEALSKDILKLFKLAKRVARGETTLERINENINGIQEQTRLAKVHPSIHTILAELEICDGMKTADAAERLADKCKGPLRMIRNELGATDEFYLNLSSAVVHRAQQAMVAETNATMESYEVKMGRLYGLKALVRQSLRVHEVLASFDMSPDVAEQFRKNRSGLNSIARQLNISVASPGSSRTTRTTTRTTTTGQRTGGPRNDSSCYIATMAYGDVNHPQVEALRRFRDGHLRHTSLGKAFIRFYYRHSPNWVERLQNRPMINRIIRMLLDRFIKHVP